MQERGGGESKPPEPPVQEPEPVGSFIKRAILGAPRSIKDPRVFHKISLIAFLAWIGLGADGLSSSSYGPDEAFRALGSHTYLAIGLAVATALTVFIITYAYSRIVEHFPYGGGGYVVASKLLGPRYGVVSGSALLVDYVLTISVSVASGIDQVFSVLPPAVAQYKIAAVAAVILIMMTLNMRGIKESVTVLMPIFLVFLLTHAFLIVGGIAFRASEVTHIVGQIQVGYNEGVAALGLGGVFAIFLRAYSMGAGTYTGIEAVSNGIMIMRDPKVETAKKTMVYMAVSLALTAGGILTCYLLYGVAPEAGKTMNAALLGRFAGSWDLGGFPIGEMFIILTLAAEAALLFVAAQTGFIGGAYVMSNMASDSWLPHRFTSLSDRLTMQNGVILIAGAAIIILVVFRGNTSTLVLMYSINVFLTFSLAQMGMVRYWLRNRHKYPTWSRHIVIHLIGLVLCLSILLVSVFEKFTQGGWVTLVVTTALVLFCVSIKRHYISVRANLGRLDEILSDIPVIGAAEPPALDKRAPTAVLMVSGFGGLGIHSFLNIQKLFTNYFKNFVFVSVNVVDAGSMKGMDAVDSAIHETEASLRKYVQMANQFGFAAEYRMGVGTEVLPEAKRISEELSHQYPRAIFFSSKLVFQRERWYQRLLHNETAYQMQRQLQFAGLNTMVLPIRVFSGQEEPNGLGPFSPPLKNPPQEKPSPLIR